LLLLNYSNDFQRSNSNVSIDNYIYDLKRYFHLHFSQCVKKSQHILYNLFYFLHLRYLSCLLNFYQILNLLEILIYKYPFFAFTYSNRKIMSATTVFYQIHSHLIIPWFLIQECQMFLLVFQLLQYLNLKDKNCTNFDISSIHIYFSYYR